MFPWYLDSRTPARVIGTTLVAILFAYGAFATDLITSSGPFAGDARSAWALCGAAFALNMLRIYQFAPANPILTDKGARGSVLFLRSFSDDWFGRRRREGLLSYASHLFDTFPYVNGSPVGSAMSAGWSAGPVVAVSSPDQPWFPSSAIFTSIPDGRWVSAVERLAEESRAVFFFLSDTPGLQWELRKLRTMNLLHKCVFFVPRASVDVRKRILEAAGEALGIQTTPALDHEQLVPFVVAFGVADQEAWCATALWRHGGAYRVAAKIGLARALEVVRPETVGSERRLVLNE